MFDSVSIGHLHSRGSRCTVAHEIINILHALSNYFLLLILVSLRFCVDCEEKKNKKRQSKLVFRMDPRFLFTRPKRFVDSLIGDDKTH